MRVLCIGRVSYDVSLPLPEFPQAGKKYENVTKIEGGSGSAGTAAYLLGRWGVESYIAGVIGNDLYGNRIKNEFENIGVFTKFLEINYEKDTIINYIINNEAQGSGITISGNSQDVKLTKPAFEMESPNGLLLDGYEYEASINSLVRYKEAISLINAHEATKEELELCNKVSYIVCSYSFGEEVSGIKISFENPTTLVQMYQALKNKFNKEIIVTLGEKGVLYALGSDVRIMPAIKVTSKDATGAKDIFAGALLYGILAGRKLEVAIKLANITAGLSTVNVGIKNSTFKIEEIETYAKNINEPLY